MPSESSESDILTLVNLEEKPTVFFKRLINASCSAIIITDASAPDNPAIYANPAFVALTGFSLDDVLGRNCRFLQGGDRDQPILDEMRRCLAEQRPFIGTLRNYRKDGTPFWSRMHIFPMPDGDGTICNYAAFIEDISAMVDAQQASQQAHARLSDVLESVSDGCFSVDHDWRVTYINSKGASWLGRQPGEVIDRNVWKLFPDAVDGPFHQTYHRAMANHEFASCESYYEPLGLWIEGRAYPSPDGLTVFFVDVSARKESEARLVHLATHDSLTGLHNRLSCLRALQAALTRARAHGNKVAVLFVDLDHFKEVNDAHGHQAGDLALQEIGRRLAAFTSPGTMVARISGDEFVFVLEDGDAEAALALAPGVLQRLAEPIQVDGHLVTIGASIGIAIGDGEVESPDELLNDADTAMYEAKANGRHTSVLFAPQARDLVKQRLLLRQEVFSALDRGQFELYYQPQVSAADGAVVGAEALLRWIHPRLGVLSPGAFLSMLEDSPAISAVGAWVCEEASRQTREWELSGHKLSMAVNVSARQLGDDGLPCMLAGLIKRYGIDTACIKLEVTESMLLQDAEKAGAVLRRLKEDGFEIALDDFGTGYSNLSYLRQFPVTAIKIDRSFVTEIEQDQRCLDIVNGVIAFAKSLKLAVICEGIETEGQRVAIASTGCDMLQGYLIGKPMPAAAFRELLMTQPTSMACFQPGD
ncbi:EAL domain-containing protein [Massilia sp. 9096]|uniref:sensor domain-containing protein n=1 Tax=Massilia sp. 9096 TaxID=1500894 RepID=UPI00068C043E|nr:EAL domain-containing protein [Massilia sp. 9096]